jgi:hypothetical protein
VNATMEALYALEDAQTKAEVRGMKWVPVAEDDGKYTTVGLKPNRGSTSISRVLAENVKLMEQVTNPWLNEEVSWSRKRVHSRGWSLRTQKRPMVCQMAKNDGSANRFVR